MDFSLIQEEIADEAKTGLMYKPNYLDKYGRSVLVMRPCLQVSFWESLSISILFIFLIRIRSLSIL